MKIWPDLSVVWRSTRSAGALSFGYNRIMSPTPNDSAGIFAITPALTSIFIYLHEFISKSLFLLAISSDNSLIIVTMSTNARGATNDIRNPTLNAGTIWDKAMSRKNRLKKYLNWWNSTRGMNDHQVYLQLFIALPGYEYFCFKSGVNKTFLNCE